MATNEELIAEARNWARSREGWSQYQYDLGNRLADALEAAAKPVTVEWEYGTVAEAFGGEPDLNHTLEAAKHVQSNTDTTYRKWTHGSPVRIYRRIKAGPWVEVTS